MLSSTKWSFPKFLPLFLFPRNRSKFHPCNWIFHQSIWLVVEILSKNHKAVVILLIQLLQQMEAFFLDSCKGFHIHFYLKKIVNSFLLKCMNSPCFHFHWVEFSFWPNLAIKTAHRCKLFIITFSAQRFYNKKSSIFNYDIDYNSRIAINLQHLNFIEKVKYFVTSDILLGLSWSSNW